MRFSLIVATLGRTTELQKLLESLDGQVHRDFEVIVVDQNTDARLIPVLSAFETRMEIRRMVSPPGLSRSRNLGLRAVTGDVVCFPDDDCCYAEGLLDLVNQSFLEHPAWHGVVGDSVNQFGELTLPWRDREGKLTLAMSWRRAISYAIFLRTQVIREIGGFNETLGVGSGSPWGSGEDNDLVLRALKAGFYVQYSPAIRVYHPKLFRTHDKSGYAKRYRYALGDGRLLRHHPMPIWWDLLFFSVPICKALAALLRLNRKESYSHWLTVAGRVRGFMSAKKPDKSAVPFPLEPYSSAVAASDIAVNTGSVSGGQ